MVFKISNMKYPDFNIVSSVLFMEIVIKVGDDYFYMLLEKPANSLATISRNHLCTDYTCGLINTVCVLIWKI